MKHKKRSGILVMLGMVLILAAAGLAGYNLVTAHQAGQNATDALTQLRMVIPKEEQPVTQNPAHLQTTDTGAEPEGDLEMLIRYPEIPDHVLNPKMEMPVQEINGTGYIGYMEIPTLELELPIGAEETPANLKKAPCRYRGSAYQNNLIVAGHHYLQHFGNLRHLSYGDVVRVVDMDGNVFVYEVADMEIIPGNGVEDMLSGDWDLTLFTCTADGSDRLTIRCVRTNQ